MLLITYAKWVKRSRIIKNIKRCFKMKEYYYSKEALVKYLIDNIPEYKEYHEKEKEWWGEDKRTYHTEIGCLLDFTGKEIDNENTKYLPFIFNLIEELVECDDENADNAAWTMFLEDIPRETCDIHPKFSVDACRKYLGPKSLKALEIINAPLSPEVLLRLEKEKQYKASIKPFLLDSLYRDINDYKEFREENIKKWHEEGLDRPLPVEMVTLLEFVKAKLVNEDHNTIKKILDLVAKTAEYAQEDHETQKLLEHWYNILKNQK
ncbi:DUF7674 family protein [Rickettsia endosymbiont of Orchestes rusci]|uniref:DUF7674 family protein n=1 Tax=Rickettsia endosymbiont of Orchestes rusci TaxID=3066250 RepID=UPI00313F265D